MNTEQGIGKRRENKLMSRKKMIQQAETSPIHVLGRAVIISEGHILLAHDTNTENTFLPGGHIEYNEGAKNALLRELREEFNGEAEINGFVGVLEHSFEYNNHTHYELNLLFSTRLLNYSHTQKPRSLEPHLEFLWQPIEKLEEANLLPSPLNAIIPDYYRKRQNSLWTSTMEE